MEMPSHSEILACLICAGVALSSLILSLTSLGPSDEHEELEALLDTALEDNALPNELLLLGNAFEPLLINRPELLLHGWPAKRSDAQQTRLAIRMLAADSELQLGRDHGWLVGLENRQPRIPHDVQVDELSNQGSLSLRRLQRQELSGSTWLSATLRSSEVSYVDESGHSSPCSRWRFGRSFCGPNEWNWMGMAEVQVSGRTERCIWAHPLSGAELHIVFPDVDGSAKLRGRYAFADSALVDSNASPVSFRVLVNDEERVKRVLPNKSGWNHFTITAQDDASETVDLRFVVSSSNDGRRHFCFDTELIHQGR
jgi:hypothetical protein